MIPAESELEWKIPRQNEGKVIQPELCLGPGVKKKPVKAGPFQATDHPTNMPEVRVSEVSPGFSP